MQHCVDANLTAVESHYYKKIILGPSWAWWLNHIGTFIVFLIGLSGNIVCLIVLCRRPFVRKSYTQYLIALSIVDTGAIICETIQAINDLYLYRMRVPFIQHNNITCKLYSYIRFIFYTMSSWIVVALAIERLVAIKYPLWSKYICSVTNARRIIISLLILTMLVQSYQLIIKGLDCSSSKSTSRQACRCKTQEIYGSIDIIFTLYIWRLILMTFVPITIIISVNIIIMSQLFDKNNFIDYAKKAQQSRHRILLLYKISRMLIIVSSIYLLLHIPGSTLEIIKCILIQLLQICNMKWQYHIYLTQDIFDLLTNFNYGINFYLYIISGKDIRRELMRRHSLFSLSSRKKHDKSFSSTCLQSSSIKYSKNKPQQQQHLITNNRLVRCDTFPSV